MINILLNVLAVMLEIAGIVFTCCLIVMMIKLVALTLKGDKNER